MRIDKIFISHWHADHFAGLLPLLETLHLCGREQPLEIYGPEARRFVKTLASLSYWDVGFRLIPIECGRRKIERICESPEYEIFAIKVRHTVPAVGYAFIERPHWRIDVKLAKKFGLAPGPLLAKIKKLGKIKLNRRTIKLEHIARRALGRKFVYSGDTLAHRPLFELARGADLLIHDGTFIEPAPAAAHPSAQQIARLAKEYKIKKLVLVHLSRRYKTTAEIASAVRQIFKKAVLARDGMRIKL
jgi:ribonuclease Z